MVLKGGDGMRILLAEDEKRMAAALVALLKQEKYDVVGPICESSDVFGKDLLLPVTKRGDLVAILSAGAYGESMARRYNMRSLPQCHFIE